MAEAIVPKGSLEAVKFGYRWDHLFFALPLYKYNITLRLVQGFENK